MNISDSLPLKDLDHVYKTLEWMEKNKIWPNGLRYLWTDAFGLVLLVSLFEETEDKKYLDMAESLVKEVYRVLGRKRGIRIGEEPDRDGQYYHYLSVWLFALWRLGQIIPKYAEMAVDLVKQTHSSFVIKGEGVIWKMKEDLSEAYPGYGMGAIDQFEGYVVYRLIDGGTGVLEEEISEMKELVEKSYKSVDVNQDLGAGMILWISQFYPDELWARHLREKSLKKLEKMWISPQGYFCRSTHYRNVKFAFTNYGISLGLQSVNKWPDRVNSLNEFFEKYKHGDEYDYNSITHVMKCVSYFPGKFIKNKIRNVT